MKTILDNPVLVVGVPRSGTTLIYNILLQHPEFKGIRNDPWIAETSIFDEYVHLTTTIFESTSWPDWATYFYNNQNAFKDFQKESIRSFLANAAKARGVKRILEKTPNHINHLDMIYETLPDVKLVHIIRHPVDVYASMRKRAKLTPGKEGAWLRVSPQTFAKEYTQKVKKIEPYKTSGAIFTIKYEDLTNNAELEVQKILQFLEITEDIGIISGETPSKAVGVFPYQSNVPVPNSNTWEGWVSKAETELIQRLCSGTLEMYRYNWYA